MCSVRARVVASRDSYEIAKDFSTRGPPFLNFARGETDLINFDLDKKRKYTHSRDVRAWP